MSRPTISVEELRDMISVDRYDLVTANEKQPVLAQAIGEHYGKALKSWAKSKVHYDRIKGQRYFGVREEMAARGDKVTDAIAEMALKKDPEFLAAKEIMEDLEAMVEDLRTLVFAYQQRSATIKLLQDQLDRDMYQYAKHG